MKTKTEWVLRPLPVKSRPRCKQCGTRLAIHKDWVGYINPVPWETMAVYKFEGKYGYEGNGHFCSLHCGYPYGVRVAKAGVIWE